MKPTKSNSQRGGGRSSPAAPVPTFTLREPCGRDWKDELLSFPVGWRQGLRKDTRWVLSGARGCLPTQVTDVRRHPDGSVADAVVWCRLDLAAGQTLTLDLQSGESPAAPDSLVWRPERGGAIVAGNQSFSVRIPASRTYPAAAAPGPVTAVKVAGGEWLGRGLLRASRDVTVKTRLLEQGPLFLRWETTARYTTQTLASIECTLMAGEDFLRIREETSRNSDLVFTFDAFPGLAPDRLLTKGGGEHMDPVVRSVNYAREETLATVDFHSGHHQMSLSWFGVYRDGAAPFLGVVELNGPTWTCLARNRVHLVCEPPERLAVRSPLLGGIKEWALVCSTTERHLKPAGSRTCNRLSQVHQRYAEAPLQKIKDWVLEWDDGRAQRPCLQCEAKGIDRARARVKADPALQRVYRSWAEALDHPAEPAADAPAWVKAASAAYDQASTRAALWVALGDRAHAEKAAALLEKEIRVSVDRFWAEGAYLRLIIFDGRMMKLWLQAYDVLKAGGFLEGDRDRRVRRDLAFLAYCFDDPAYFPERVNLLDHDDPDSFFHGLGERIGDAMCPPNFQTEYYTTYGMAGCAFRSHPRAAAWRKKAAAMCARQLAVHYYESGAYCESPNYHSHAFVMLNQLALSLRRAGERDFYKHRRFKAQFDWFCAMQTPPILLNEAARGFFAPWRFMDPGRERYAMLPGNGNTGTDASDMPLPVELAVGAAVYRDSDPALSRRCMTTWRRAGRPVSNHYNDLTFLLVADPGLPGPETLGLSSRLLTGNYVTFRGCPETENEVFVLTKNGTATHHNDFDEGGFTIWAYGSPIASDFGYHAHHAGKSTGVSDTWKHNCVEFDGKSSGFLGIEQTLPPETFISTEQADLLVSYLPINNFRDLATLGYMDRVPVERIEYRRYTLFVKPHYLLILDSIQACRCAHRWWLHAQADSVAVDGPRVRFTGKFGVDLLAQFIEPAAPVITAGEWSVMKHIVAAQSLAKDWRVWVAPARPGQEFKVTSGTDSRVVEVETPDYHDTILLAHFPFRYESGTFTFHGRAGLVRRRGGRAPETVLLDGTRLTVTV